MCGKGSPPTSDPRIGAVRLRIGYSDEASAASYAPDSKIALRGKNLSRLRIGFAAMDDQTVFALVLVCGFGLGLILLGIQRSPTEPGAALPAMRRERDQGRTRLPALRVRLPNYRKRERLGREPVFPGA